MLLCVLDHLRHSFFSLFLAGGASDSDEEGETSKITLSYQSKRTSEREGLQDMGATLTLETESTNIKVKGQMWLHSLQQMYIHVY